MRGPSGCRIVSRRCSVSPSGGSEHTEVFVVTAVHSTVTVSTALLAWRARGFLFEILEAFTLLSVWPRLLIHSSSL
jgi:hypothetical protein